jgi:hypothetical protein
VQDSCGRKELEDGMTMTRDWERLDSLLSTMDIPEQRKRDLHWLSRNLPFNNLHHPNYSDAIREVLRLLRLADL